MNWKHERNYLVSETAELFSELLDFREVEAFLLHSLQNFNLFKIKLTLSW